VRQSNRNILGLSKRYNEKVLQNGRSQLALAGTYKVIDHLWDVAATLGLWNLSEVYPGQINVWNSFLDDSGPEVTTLLIVLLCIVGNALKIQRHEPAIFANPGIGVDGDRCSRWKGWRFEADAEAKKEAENVTHVEISCVGSVGGKVAEKKLRLEAFTS